MTKKQWASIVIVALIVGTAGSIFCTRFLIPYLSTFRPLGFLRNLQTTTPIIINRREEVRLDDGVNITDVVKQAEPATITLYSGKARADLKPAGSGVILTSDGVIMTTREAAGNGADLRVMLNDGRIYPALLRALDPKSSLAVITIEARDLPVYQLADAQALEIGQKILALGTGSQEFTRNFASGLVTSTVANSASLSQVLATSQMTETLGTDAVMTSSFTGGPVIDLQGRLIGLVSDSTGKILTSEAIQGALSSYLSQGKIVRPFWGIRYFDLSKSLAALIGQPQAGALVAGFEDGSPAAKAGLSANDLIVKVNGLDVTPAQSLERLANSKSGDVALTVIRNGQTQEIKFNVPTR
ncbi:MAG: S1C family serine protease [Candidatus Saccharibacteria bacterium]